MKKKQTNLLKLIKNNWYFLLILIPLSFLMGEIKYADNDFWFIVNTGKNIVQNGINYTDTFTIHSGLKIIVQQWGTSVIFWTLFNTFGKYGILALVLLTTFVLIAIYYKLCYSVSKNKIISVILTIIFIILFEPFITTRPQLFTYLFLILELLLLERYVKNNNKKYLYPLPIISLLMINLHASMWIMQFAFIITFLLNKINILNTRINNYKIKPIIIVTIIMFLVGLINPYIYKSMFFFLYSTSDTINKNIAEMKPFDFTNIICKKESIIMLIIIFSQTFVKKFKIDIRHFLLICGTAIMMFTYIKCLPYFIIVTLYSIAYGYKNVDFSSLFNKIKLINKKVFKIIYSIIWISASYISLLIFSYACYAYIAYSDYSNPYEKMINTLLNNYDKEDIILYTTYENGGYTEYRGIKSYIDPRAELFLKKQNGKEDILDEMIRIENDDLSDKEYEEFINKYGFTHFMVRKDTRFYNYISNNYELLYEDEKLGDVLFSSKNNNKD